MQLAGRYRHGGRLRRRLRSVTAFRVVGDDQQRYAIIELPVAADGSPPLRRICSSPIASSSAAIVTHSAVEKMRAACEAGPRSRFRSPA